jgi:outer membrane lipoprotein SlyB
MKLQTIVVPLVAAVLASGCASSDLRDGGNEYLTTSAHSNQNRYAVIDSIKSAPLVGGAMIGQGQRIGQANEQQAVYSILVRFDDRSYRTVTQSGLDGLRVGDGVRIEDDRVRRY